MDSRDVRLWFCGWLEMTICCMSLRSRLPCCHVALAKTQLRDDKRALEHDLESHVSKPISNVGETYIEQC